MDSTVDGLEDFERNIHKLQAATKQEADRLLAKAGMKIVAEGQRNLKKEPNSNYTGALSNSGRVLKDGPLSYQAGFERAYAEDVENGKPPGDEWISIKLLAEWAKKKLRVDDKEKMSVGYFIARKIYYFGTKGKHFFSEAIETVSKTLKEDLDNLITRAERKV